MTGTGKYTWLGIGIATVVLTALPFAGINTYVMSFLFILMLHASLTISWNILGGYAGYPSFGHVAFVGIGGYTTGLLQTLFGWSPLFTALFGALMAALVAVIIGYPILRLRGPYFSLVTLIVSLAINVIVTNMPGIKVTEGIFVTPPSDSVVVSKTVFYEAMLCILVLTIVAAQLIEHSRFGMGLVAIREDEEVAGTQGINPSPHKLLAFTVSAWFAGLAGSIFAWYQGFLSPSVMFNVNLSIMVVLMAMVGGTNSWLGALSGAVLVTVFQEVLTLWIGSTVAQIAFGILLVIVILFLPNGLLGWLRKYIRSKGGMPSVNHS